MSRPNSFESYHPVVTFAFFVLAFVFGMCVRHPAFHAISVTAAALCCLSVRGRGSWRLIAAMLPAFALLSLVNPLFNSAGETVLFTWLGGRPYTAEALAFGASTGAMLVSMLLWFFSYDAVMTSEKFTYLFGGLIPGLSLVLTMALRLVPGYQRKASEIAFARAGVGLSSSGGVAQRAKGAVPVMSALVTWALEGGVVTADSMRGRGWGVARRASFSRYRFGLRDALALAVLVIMAVISAFCLMAGAASFEYLPQIVEAPAGPILLAGLAAYACMLLLPVFVNVKEALRWRILRSKI